MWLLQNQLLYKYDQISLLNHAWTNGGQKQVWLNKFMQIEVDEVCSTCAPNLVSMALGVPHLCQHKLIGNPRIIGYLQFIIIFICDLISNYNMAESAACSFKTTSSYMYYQSLNHFLLCIKHQWPSCIMGVPQEHIQVWRFGILSWILN